MNERKIFATHRIGGTLVIMPQVSVSTLAGDCIYPEIIDILREMETDRATNVLVDFERVQYFGSVMIGAMHKLWLSVRSSAGKMALCNLSAVGREVLQVAHLDTIWPIYRSRDEALAALSCG